MLRSAKKRTRKLIYFASFVSLCLLLVFFYYFVLIGDIELNDSQNNIRIHNEIEVRLNALEEGLKENGHLLTRIKERVDDVIRSVYISNANLGPLGNANEICRNRNNLPDVDIAMENVYNEVEFDNPDGGVWKQGWSIELNSSKINAAKLKVFVVPHSHNDPGWVKTFDQYFKTQTRPILDNMLQKLSENSNYKFIWAEISYLANWWDTLKNDDSKEMMKTLLDKKQLEIVTGGWVMNDEANTHYFAMISQLVEGHEWLLQQLNYKPQYGWAIDPFGLSPTMAFLLKRMGLKGMVIQRVHYSIKKYLAQRQQLEFQWRQYWEGNDIESDILCHIEPFYSYDIPHTCGPDPKICCQFDFKRLPPNKVSCPWKVAPQKITSENVAQKAELLLTEYRKKSMLYKTSSLLIPLGDDFRYDKAIEWDAQGKNYQKLFDYMNSRSDWNVQISFGTLQDYFESIQTKENMPSLVGDFFTYSDRDDHYWSGYYSTRPFHKRFDRILESYLRAAEIIFTLASILNGNEDMNSLVGPLTYSRRTLGLFQHHDAITGTSKDVVVNDYASRLFQSLLKTQQIIAESAMSLFHFSSLNKKDDVMPFKFIEIFNDGNSLPKIHVINLNSKHPKWYIVVYNTLAFRREELVCLYIISDNNEWVIRSSSGQVVSSEDVQVNYVWSPEGSVDKRLEACFFADLKPLSLTQYSVELLQDSHLQREFSKTTLYHFQSNDSERLHAESETPTEIELSQDFVKVVFNGADGMMRKVIFNNNKGLYKTYDIRVQMMTYGTRKGKNIPKSGAYLFIPDSEDAQDLNYSKPKIVVTKGLLLSRMEVLIDQPIPMKHQITLVKGRTHIDVENSFLLTKEGAGNKELVMRFYTNVENKNTFYTDLNGFQMIRRKKYDKIPLQGNVYPMPTLMYIEDSITRLNVLSAQPLGTTSIRSGLIDIFLDRKLLQDDQRGVGQGITDNRITTEKFKLIFESKPFEDLKPTLEVQQESLKQINAPILMYTLSKSPQGELSFMAEELPCAVHLLNFRTMVSTRSEFDLFLHHFGVSCGTTCINSNITLGSLFSKSIVGAIEPVISEMSLSLLFQSKDNISLFDDIINVKEMDLSVFRLKLK